MTSLPAGVRRKLVLGLGAFMREMPAPELPPPLRRFRGFRPRSLHQHERTILDAFEEDAFRAKVIDWLSTGTAPVDEETARLLDIASRREDGWEEALAEAVPDDEPPAPAAPKEDRHTEALERERAKTKKARDELRTERSAAAAQRKRLEARISELERLLEEERAVSATATQRSLAKEKDAAALAAKAERELRRSAAETEQAAEVADEAKKEAAEAKRTARRAERELDALSAENAALRERVEQLESQAPSPQPEQRAPRRRTPLGTPRGRFEDDPLTLDHWLESPGARLIVDGYNVTMAEGAFGDLGLETQRDRLVADLARLAGRHGVQTVIVFDGRDFEGRIARRTDVGLVSVRYSRGEIADDAIVAMVGDLDPAVPVVVVTNDRELRERVAGLGANVAGSGQLLDLIR